ncbi:NADP-dependent oxidoreductase [Microbacterium sp. NPDC079995]|uniref:quinone oxidoreductase family protein n=1 Tax=unclassified Microbacterium TaxID=2609290 RepID=UPI00344E1994
MAQAWFATGPGGIGEWELRDVEVPAPGPGEVTIRIHAAGMNPADVKHSARPGASFPVPLGYEVSGEITAIGPDTAIGSGVARVGDEVLAFRVSGGYATELTIPAEKAFHKPSTLTHPEAANLLLAGATAAELLDRSGAREGDLVLFHAASGAVGVSFLQQARTRGVRVVGTAGPANLDVVRRYGGVAVEYGEGLVERAREAASGAPFVAALDGVGTDEALEASFELVADRQRIITIVRPDRVEPDGIVAIGGMMRASAVFRDGVRGPLVDLAAQGLLEVPVARTYPLNEARNAAEYLMTGHPGGKLALIP